MKRHGKVARQPRQQEKESVVVGSPSQRESVDFRLQQKICQRNAVSRSWRVFHLSPTCEDELAFMGRQSLVFAGIAVDEVEQRKIEKADESRGSKTPPPAEIQEQHADERDSNGSREFCRCIGDRRRQPSFLSREPVSQGFGIGGKCRRFTYPQK